ncbi:MAG: homoserine dehydrogenase [Fimbriimonadales bacterium]|nr:MAG: homoserine dehydrogenase [Fimbriimonadales bacterium]
METLRIGLLGLGTVGQSVCELIQAEGEAFERKTGLRPVVTVACVRDASRERRHAPDRITTDPMDVVAADDVDVVVEVMGGQEPAFELIQEAIRQGKQVVSANKELLARRGRELEEDAAAKGVCLLFDAAVCGGIPVLNTLRHRFAADEVERIIGIVNGTSNFVLTQMTEFGEPFAEALAVAQEEGYAEADPTYDVEGFDAQSKLALLVAEAFGARIAVEEIHREGIEQVSPRDIEFADLLGYRIKPLAVAARKEGGIEARIHPALVPLTNPLSKVDGADNAVLIRSKYLGDLMLLGPGAGGHPTAAAILGDLEEIATGKSFRCNEKSQVAVQPIEETVARFYVRMTSQDRPKALGQIASAFGDYEVSLSALEMHELPENRSELVFLTHPALERNLKKALALIEHLPMIERIESWFRIES